MKLFLGEFLYPLLYFIVKSLNPGMMKRWGKMLKKKIKKKLHINITNSVFFKLENTSKKDSFLKS